HGQPAASKARGASADRDRARRGVPDLMRRWLPRPTLRLRLTLLYGGLFLAAGAVLLVITYELVAHSPPATARDAVIVARGIRPGAPPPLPPVGPPRLQIQSYAGKVTKTFQKLTAAQQAQLNNVAFKAKAALHSQQ